MKTTIIPNLLGRIQSVEIQEGETIETKVARITQNKEPITDSAPIIFTEKNDGVSYYFRVLTLVVKEANTPMSFRIRLETVK